MLRLEWKQMERLCILYVHTKTVRVLCVSCDCKSTYINFTQHHVHNAPNDDDKVKDVPGISKVTLQSKSTL